MKVVEVTWLDANHQFGPVRLAEVELGEPTTTVGYFLKRDKKAVSVAMEITEEGYRNVTSIPAALVKRVRNVGR